jgi:hypothetical protein
LAFQRIFQPAFGSIPAIRTKAEGIFFAETADLETGIHDPGCEKRQRLKLAAMPDGSETGR